MDWQQLKRIDDKRDTMASISDSNIALRRAKKEAYFQVIEELKRFKCVCLKYYL